MKSNKIVCQFVKPEGATYELVTWVRESFGVLHHDRRPVTWAQVKDRINADVTPAFGEYFIRKADYIII